jgi:ASCH domain
MSSWFGPCQVSNVERAIGIQHCHGIDVTLGALQGEAIDRSTMKILSIRQPWAHLIVSGRKNIENRSWPTSYRGPVLIHASQKVNRAACIERGLDPTELERGGVVGIAQIADCVDAHDSRWFKGPFGFVLRKRRKIPFVAWKGTLGLRDAPPELLRRIPRRNLDGC